MPTQDDVNAALLGTWWRVPEEDAASGGHRVFRRDGAPLPPARGRSGLRLEAGGVATLLHPGPTDRREGSPSRWHVDAQGRLHVEGSADADGVQIQDLAPDRLALKP